MAKFEITFINGATETIEADETQELRGWIIFNTMVEHDLIGQVPQEKTRIKSTRITRVDRVEG